MKLYCGIDLHSNNSVLTILDEKDQIIYQRRLKNDLKRILAVMDLYGGAIEGIAIESTFNWYWLVDGLMEAGYRVHLVNTAAVKQYEGLKYGDDHSDARWLAHLLRLGILPEGYIYPKEDRAVRDLLRKRGQLVQLRTTNILSVQSLMARNIGSSMSGNQIKKLQAEEVSALLPNEDLALAANSNIHVMRTLDEQIRIVEKAIKEKAKLKPEFDKLQSVPGIGIVLALTIMLETGDISRFAQVGKYASYCRCVGSTRLSNGKQKGKGNHKNGNRYLSWAFVEAANFAIRYNDNIKRYYQRKQAKTNKVVALKTVAHKLASACYYIMRDQGECDLQKGF